MKSVIKNYSLSSLLIEFNSRFTFYYRVWLIFAGGISILGVPFWFTPIEQGYFYTFTSLIAAQVLFELGFGFVITQFTAHEMVGVRDGLAHHHSRVAHLLQFTNTWFNYAALIFVLAVGGFGIWFFNEKAALPVADWSVPWAVLVLATGLNLRYGPRLAIIEGSGEVGQVARLRLIQSVLGNLLMWAALTFGAKLWAVPIVAIVASISTMIWLSRHQLILSLQSSLKEGLSSLIDWKKEYLPMQWRIALSWSSGYLIFQAITPITFARLGPVEAGQIGLALAIFNGVQTLGMSWMNSRAPEFGELIAKNDRLKLNELFKGLFKKSTLIAAIGVGLVILGANVLHQLDISIVKRIPNEAVLACFGVATVVNAMVFSMALYMRCHKEEPMLVSSVVGGILILIGIYVGTAYSLLMTAFFYALITTIIGLPWSWLLFRRYYPAQIT